jgi:hypothetical protein
MVLPEAVLETELPAPLYRSGSMPEMMKHKASTAASVLTILTERRSTDLCGFCLCSRAVTGASCRIVRSGRIETLSGKTNERGTSSSGNACNREAVSRKSDSLFWQCWQVDI